MPAQPVTITGPEILSSFFRPESPEVPDVGAETTQYVGSCTFLNMSGDITIVWGEDNREKVLELIRKKMAEGYSFFTTKKFLFGKVSRRVAVTKKNLRTVGELIISDAEFAKMVKQMGDEDVAALVTDGDVATARRTGRKDLVAMSRARRAEDVIDHDSMAVRPIRGG